jgi:hypothetical protein
MKNDCLKELAHKLSESNIASLRFDKRGVAESKDAVRNEADLTFEDYVNKYDPQEEIKKLKIPVLILQGTNNIQVKVEDDKRLASTSPNSKLVILKNVNHIFKDVSGDKKENIKTYNDNKIPIDEELVKIFVSFILTK